MLYLGSRNDWSVTEIVKFSIQVHCRWSLIQFVLIFSRIWRIQIRSSLNLKPRAYCWFSVLWTLAENIKKPATLLIYRSDIWCIHKVSNNIAKWVWFWVHFVCFNSVINCFVLYSFDQRYTTMCHCKFCVSFFSNQPISIISNFYRLISVGWNSLDEGHHQ